MKLFIFLLFSLFFTINNSYSIKVFINFLQEKGWWDIIYNIKITYCDDIAIDVCTTLTESPSDCVEVVRIYMDSSPKKCPPRPLETMKQILIKAGPLTSNGFTDRLLNRTISKCCPLI